MMPLGTQTVTAIADWLKMPEIYLYADSVYTSDFSALEPSPYDTDVLSLLLVC